MRVFRYYYDGQGRTKLVVDPQGDSTLTAYDSRNRDTLRIEPNGARTRFVWDDLYLREVIDAIGQVYEFEQNLLGQDTLEVDPGGAAQRYQYDLNGNLWRWTNRRGQLITYTFDQFDRMTARDAAGQTATFAYSANDSLVVAQNAFSLDTVVTDLASRPVRAATIRGGRNHALRYFYHGSGRRDDMALDTGNVFVGSWGWDFDSVSGQLAILRDAASRSAEIGYNADLLASTIQLPANEVTRSTGYSSAHLESLIAYDSTVPALLGNRYIRQDSLARVIEAWPATEDTFRTFRYDAAHRLFRSIVNVASGTGQCIDNADYGFECTDTATVGIRLYEYVYDSVGNEYARVGLMDPGNRIRYVETDSLNVLNHISLYDADGNVLELRSTSIYQVFHWNALSQLDSVSTYDFGVLQHVTRYRYDAWGRRVRSQTGADSTGFIWDGDVTVAETDASTNISARYTYAPGSYSPHAITRDGQTSYYMYDEARNVIGLLKQDGSVPNRYRYSPYGVPMGEVDSIPNRHRFAGQRWDSESGLVYMRNRYYNPMVRRFISEDPIGLAGGINQYVYAGNDPINGSDPLGLQSTPGPACVLGGICLPAIEVTAHIIRTWTDNFLKRDFISDHDLSSDGNDGGVGNYQRMADWGARRGGATGSLAVHAGAALNAIADIGDAVAGVRCDASGTCYGSPPFLTQQGAFTRGGLLNSNRYLRIGIGQHGGRKLFRISGTIVEKFKKSGHINLPWIGPW